VYGVIFTQSNRSPIVIQVGSGVKRLVASGIGEYRVVIRLFKLKMSYLKLSTLPHKPLV